VAVDTGYEQSSLCLHVSFFFGEGLDFPKCPKSCLLAKVTNACALMLVLTCPGGPVCAMKEEQLGHGREAAHAPAALRLT
jgi:hypothetical protein